MVLQLVMAGKYRRALEELELWVAFSSLCLVAVLIRARSYLPSPPYQDNPSLHVYAGMVCIYLAQPDEPATGTRGASSWNEGLLRQARQYFERAVALEQDDVVATSWLAKVCLTYILRKPLSDSSQLPSLIHSTTAAERGGSPPSDDEMTLDGEDSTQQPKRTRTEPSSSPTAS